MSLNSEPANEFDTKAFASTVIPVNSGNLVQTYSLENLRFPEY